MLENADPDNILLEIEAEIFILEGYDITMEDIELRRVEKENFAAATISLEEIGDVSLVLDMSLNEDLVSKGLARDIIRHVQAKRKEKNLDVEALIKLEIWIDSKEQLFDNEWAHIQIETRAGNASINQGDIPEKIECFEVDGIRVNFSVKEIN